MKEWGDFYYKSIEGSRVVRAFQSISKLSQCLEAWKVHEAHERSCWGRGSTCLKAKVFQKMVLPSARIALAAVFFLIFPTHFSANAMPFLTFFALKEGH